MTEEGQEAKLFRIFYFKEPEFIMKTMDSCMTLEESEITDTIREYKGIGPSIL